MEEELSAFPFHKRQLAEANMKIFEANAEIIAAATNAKKVLKIGVKHGIT